MRASVPPHHGQWLVWMVFFISAIQVGRSQYHTATVKAANEWHGAFSRCYPYGFFGEVSKSLPHLKKWDVYFLIGEYTEGLCFFSCIWREVLYQVYALQWFFSPQSIICVFIPLKLSFEEQKFHSDEVQSITFFFCRLCYWCHIHKIFARPKDTKIFSCDYFRSFRVLDFTFRSTIYFGLIFVYNMRYGSKFTWGLWIANCAGTICWKDGLNTRFLDSITFVPLWKNQLFY